MNAKCGKCGRDLSDCTTGMAMDCPCSNDKKEKLALLAWMCEVTSALVTYQADIPIDRKKHAVEALEKFSVLVGAGRGDQP